MSRSATKSHRWMLVRGHSIAILAGKGFSRTPKPSINLVDARAPNSSLGWRYWEKRGGISHASADKAFWILERRYEKSPLVDACDLCRFHERQRTNVVRYPGQRVWRRIIHGGKQNFHSGWRHL